MGFGAQVQAGRIAARIGPGHDRAVCRPRRAGPPAAPGGGISFVEGHFGAVFGGGEEAFDAQFARL